MHARSLLLAAACLAVACNRSESRSQAVPTVAAINGEVITAEDFLSELKRAGNGREGLSPQSDEELLALKKAVIENMVQRALLLQAARSSQVNVAPERVERELLRLKADYPGGSFDEALAQGEMTVTDLKERTRSRLIVEKLFADQVFARIAVTDQEVESYYDEHKADFEEPERVHAMQIVVKSAEEAKRILGDIRNKKISFEEAAMRFSVAPEGKLGGDLGLFGKGVMPPVFDQVCFRLEPGRVSEVVSSEYGFHIFKVTEKKQASHRSIDDVRAAVESRLRKVKEAKAQADYLAELRTKAQIKVDDALLAKLR